MTPERIQELRAAGVLTPSGPLTQTDEARIALLDLYELARRRALGPDRVAMHGASELDGRSVRARRRTAMLAHELRWYLDALMADTPRGRALRWARAQAKRRARRRTR